MFAQMKENVCILYAVFINLMSLTVWHRWWARLLRVVKGRQAQSSRALPAMGEGAAAGSSPGVEGPNPPLCLS